MNRKHLLIMIAISLMPIALTKCKTNNPDIKTGVDVGLTIADSVCTELENGSVTPEWVTLACNGVDVANKIKVFMPRKEWHSIRARSTGIDAGPGK